MKLLCIPIAFSAVIWYNTDMRTQDGISQGGSLLALWGELSQRVFPFIMEEVGELDDGHNVRVRDPKKVQLHIMLGIIVIAVFCPGS